MRINYVLRMRQRYNNNPYQSRRSELDKAVLLIVTSKSLASQQENQLKKHEWFPKIIA